MRSFCENIHPLLLGSIMVAYDHHGSRPSQRKEVAISNHLEVSISNNHHCHRLATMTTTHHDHGHGDQDDIMRGDDLPPHLNHPGTENPENPNEFHSFTQQWVRISDSETHPPSDWLKVFR